MSVETLLPSSSAQRDAPGDGAPPAKTGTEGNGREPAPSEGRSEGRRGSRAPIIGPSVLRMSLTARLTLAAALLVPLWVAVALVVHSAAGE